MGSNATTWDIVLHYWTVTIFVPAILLIIATLAVLTRVIDDYAGDLPHGYPPCAAAALIHGT